jgi:PD-(D/E)XK nuclease family transposase
MFEMMEKPISQFVLKEDECLVDYPIDGLELVFVELPKFQRSLNQLETLTDKWIYFLQHAPDLRTVPETMGEVVEIRQAFEMATQATLTPEELDELEHQLFFIQDQRGAITKASRQALQQGIEQGDRQARLAIAQRMLSGMDDAAIALLTDLPIADIQQLRQSRSKLVSPVVMLINLIEQQQCHDRADQTSGDRIDHRLNCDHVRRGDHGGLGHHSSSLIRQNHG